VLYEQHKFSKGGYVIRIEKSIVITTHQLPVVMGAVDLDSFD
jgi:hypothetical protein